ncbi:hypothetical protein Tco_0057001, partial [Tanacetum coccineum]
MSMEALQAQEDLIKSIENFLKKFNRISFGKTPKVLLHAWDNFIEVKHAQPEEVQELLSKLVQDIKIISDDQSGYINSGALLKSLSSIPSESKGVPKVCDVPFHNNSPPLNISKDQSEDFSDSNVDSVTPPKSGSSGM